MAAWNNNLTGTRFVHSGIWGLMSHQKINEKLVKGQFVIPIGYRVKFK